LPFQGVALLKIKKQKHNKNTVLISNNIYTIFITLSNFIRQPLRTSFENRNPKDAVCFFVVVNQTAKESSWQ
jgi:hypothetical protein